MKKISIYIALAGLLILCTVAYWAVRHYKRTHRLTEATATVNTLTQDNKIQDGDIIFQMSLSRQSKAIALATHSNYTHCGIIFSFDTGTCKYYVIEAENKVKWTPLNKWIARGQDGYFVIKRVVPDPPLPLEMFRRLRAICESYSGKPYDPYFSWSDDRVYCSELVWKAYHKLIGLSIGELQLLKDFDLSDKAVKAKLEERYGNKIPLNDTVISPAAIFKSSMLRLVYESK